MRKAPALFKLTPLNATPGLVATPPSASWNEPWYSRNGNGFPRLWNPLDT